ncbi:hypothetical protein D3C86_1316840 [compost metagenome]
MTPSSTSSISACVASGFATLIVRALNLLLSIAKRSNLRHLSDLYPLTVTRFFVSVSIKQNTLPFTAANSSLSPNGILRN